MSERPLSSNSPIAVFAAENSSDTFGTPKRKAAVRTAQSSPPSLYFEHLNQAVQSAFSSPEDENLSDIFGNSLELGCEELNLQ